MRLLLSPSRRLVARRPHSQSPSRLQVKNVETLKGRFGEQALQGCDVMIKDLQDSRRIDETVHQQLPVRPLLPLSLRRKEIPTRVVPQDVPLHATVVSRLFWPSFQPAPLKLPGQIGRCVSSPLLPRLLRAPSDPIRPCAQSSSFLRPHVLDRQARQEAALAAAARLGQPHARPARPLHHGRRNAAPGRRHRALLVAGSVPLPPQRSDPSPRARS